MAAPSQAKIREYLPEDDKLVRFIAGKSTMEGLAVANQRVYTHPMTVALWVALSSMMVQLMRWWPNFSKSWLEVLRPLPAFAAMIMPIIFLVDWIQRPQFEDPSAAVLRYPDLYDVRGYYGRGAPASGFWIFDLGKTFVGLVAIDASPDALARTRDESAAALPPAPAPADKKAAKEAKKIAAAAAGPPSTVALLRHFFVEEPYRRADAQDDLLRFALARAFAPSSPVQSVRVRTDGLATYIERAVRRAGFVRDDTVDAGKVGLLGWRRTEWVLQRAAWEARGPGAQ